MTAFTDDSDLNLDDGPEPEDQPEGSPNNRLFVILMIAAIAVIAITLICIVIFLVNRFSQGQSAQQTQIALVNENNTAVALIIEQTAAAQAWTPTPTNTLPPPTNTQVVALPSNTPTNTATESGGIGAPAETGTPDPRTATVAALLTGTARPGATSLPDTGFFDDIGASGMGLPALVGIAVVLVVVIFVARRLRSA